MKGALVACIEAGNDEEFRQIDYLLFVECFFFPRSLCCAGEWTEVTRPWNCGATTPGSSGVGEICVSWPFTSFWTNLTHLFRTYDLWLMTYDCINVQFHNFKLTWWTFFKYQCWMLKLYKREVSLCISEAWQFDSWLASWQVANGTTITTRILDPGYLGEREGRRAGAVANGLKVHVRVEADTRTENFSSLGVSRRQQKFHQSVGKLKCKRESILPRTRMNPTMFSSSAARAG